jgi:predicted transcriptional regulator
MTLLKSSPKTNDEISQELQVSKSIVNISLKKLLNLGLTNRTKEIGNKAGRPKYVYYVIKIDELKDKVVREIEDCVNNIRNLVPTQLALQKMEVEGMESPISSRGKEEVS